MFILVVLLGILGIPRAFLKPTAAKGELLISNSRGEESRSKRQTEFFDLLQQTIEKYGNCADEHLAHLQALANYPQQFSPPFATCPGATNPHENNAHLKCIKVNLCTLQNQTSHTKPANSFDPRIANDSHNLIPYFLANRKTVGSGSNRYGLGNAPIKFSSKYSSRNNFTYFPVNQIILSRLLNRPEAAQRKSVLPASLENTTVVETTMGSGVANITSSVQTNNCLCSEDAKNTTQLPLPNKLGNARTTEKQENCSCLIALQPDLAAKNSTASKGVESNQCDNKLSYNESSTINQNISLLFQQLDEMSHSINNDDLKKILEQLKTYKSAFKINFNETNSTKSNPSTTTATPTRDTKKSIYQMFKESFQITKSSEAKDKNVELSKNLKEDNFKNETNWHNFNSNQFVNEIDIKSINSSMQSSENANHNITTLSSINQTNEIQYLQNLTDVKSTFSDLSASTTDSPTTLNSHIISNQALQNLRDEMKALMSNIKDKNAEKDSEQNRSITRQVDASQNNATYINSHHTNRTISNIYDLLNNNNFHTANLNKSSNAKSPPPSKNSSKITISITSNGSFKNIQFEHSDKNFETNEKEPLNMATPNPQTQSLDMMGTGSRHVNIIKQPQMKAPYAEPMLSEMYSSKNNFKTKPPLTLYWHKVEEKPSKLKRIPSEGI